MANNTTYVVKPKAEHTHTVIFLHGGNSGCREFADEFFEGEASTPVDQPRTLPAIFPNIRWVFPSVPLSKSQRYGIEMPLWFDMWSVKNPTEPPELQQSGLDQSMDKMFKVIKEEGNLLPQEKMFLAGIGQGFATVIAAFLTKADPSKKFAGLIGLCSWMPAALLGAGGNQKFDRRASIGSTPIFLGHTEDDDIIPIEYGLELQNFLSSQGLRVEWTEYDEGGHWVNEPQGVDDISGGDAKLIGLTFINVCGYDDPILFPNC
ncbi:lysophospholipase II [Xylaria sp. FL0064]|nr:lysophospholipase II [Xylaria sp. FL0064]